MKTSTIIKKAAAELNLPHKQVWGVYKAYWTFIRQHVSSLPIKGNITEEEFNKLRPNINIPELGKFYLDWERLCNKKKENERHKDKETSTTIHNSSDNT
jgi:hypothetical protein